MAQDFNIVTVALNESSTYAGQNECTSVDLRNRIGEYWDFLGFPSRDGCTDIPWSGELESAILSTTNTINKIAYRRSHSLHPP